MKGTSCPWSAKGRDQRDPNPTVATQVHKLPDAPPYSSVQMTSHGIEAVRSESEKLRTMDSWRAPESERTSSGNGSRGEKDAWSAYGPYGRGYARDGNNKVYDEGVNEEAEEFIEAEHQKLKFLKWVSSNSISY